MNAKEILEGLSYQEKRVLLTLNQLNGNASPERIFEAGKFEQLVEVMNAASWLQAKGLVTVKESARKCYSLKTKDINAVGLPERRALNYLATVNGVSSLKEMEAHITPEVSSLAVGWLKRKGLANIDKSSGLPIITLTDQGRKHITGDMADETFLKILEDRDLFEEEADKGIITQLKSRQDIISERLVISRELIMAEAGREVISLGIELTQEVAQLTPEMIQSGKWKEVQFRKYDIRTFASAVYPAKKHPLTRMADEVRRIFIEMGFSEIDDEFVQPAFWNMDALFTPQDHPARDLQDTFYLKNPARLDLEDEVVVEKVKQMHENGGDTGSLGWRYKWSRTEAERALLRTHTTVNSVRYLAKHPEPPAKLFSIGRIFRNESLDMTHLPEFVQIEGFIMEEDASFDMLVAVLKDFYHRMGFDTVRVRPGPFPYTEPSLEIDIYYNGTWMELGGAGVFRPEVTAPLGIHHPVLAWGLGFERLAMLRYGLKDIRELYATDMDTLRQSPII